MTSLRYQGKVYTLYAYVASRAMAQAEGQLLETQGHSVVVRPEGGRYGVYTFQMRKNPKEEYTFFIEPGPRGVGWTGYVYENRKRVTVGYFTTLPKARSFSKEMGWRWGGYESTRYGKNPNKNSKSQRVVIRGEKFRVARIMADHGIPFIFVKEAKGNVVGDVPEQHIQKLSNLLHSRPDLEGRYARHEKNPPLMVIGNPRRGSKGTPPEKDFSYKGYSVKYNPFDGMYYISKGGFHISAAQDDEQAKAQIDLIADGGTVPHIPRRIGKYKKNPLWGKRSSEPSPKPHLPRMPGPVMSMNVISIRYKHFQDDKFYEHVFGNGVRMTAKPNGTIVLSHATKPIWDDFPE